MKPILRFCFCFLFIVLLGCEGDGPGGDIGDFTNAWQVIKGSSEGLVFITATDVDSTKGTGNLEAQDQPTIGGVYNMKGSFQWLDVKLRYLTFAENGNTDNGPNEGKSYSGKYDKSSQPYMLRLVNLANHTDSLVLRRS